MQERWRPIPGWGNLYEVSDHGRVRKGQKILQASTQQRGHKIVSLFNPKRQKYVHRLVLEAFVGPCPVGHETRHLDGNPAHNALSNLAWGTRSENYDDRARLGEHNPPRGRRNPRAVLNENLVRKIRIEATGGRTHASIAAECNIKESTIRAAISGQTWGWLQ